MSRQADSQSQGTGTLIGDTGSGGPVTPDEPTAVSILLYLEQYVTCLTSIQTLSIPPSSADLRKRLRDATQQSKSRKKRDKKIKEQMKVAELIDPPIRILDRKTR